MKRLCLTCRKPITGHFNRKRCKPCAKALVKRPAAHLTEAQERMVLKYAGRIFKAELAAKIKTSTTNLARWASRHAISLNCFSYKPEVVSQVCAYYGIHGRIKTQKAFPKIQIRSIVERHKNLFPPRQVRWTVPQLIELARMAGLVSLSAQARYFNRPRAHAGSIKSVWCKSFGFCGGSINGLPRNRAKHLVNQNARYIGTQYGSGDVNKRKLCLWVTIEKCLKPDVPKFLRDAIRTQAKFQRWLHGSDNPEIEIKKMIKAREGLNVKLTEVRK